MKLLIPFILGLIIALLTSCGGGTQMAEGGIGGTGVSMGKVTSFGSLYVNGVEFDVNNADFVYEQETAATIGDDSGIQVGMVVRITGTDDGVTGLADIVEYANLFEGTISSSTIASNATGTLVAMGQSVTVDADTVYDDGGLGTVLSALPAEAIIEVSGFTDGSGTILATRIEAKALVYNGEELNVKGIVSELDPSNNSFLVGTLLIDYTGLTLPPDFENGIYAEAKGTLSSNILNANDVQIEGDGDLVIADDGEEVKLEGITSSIISATSDSTLFTLNGQQVLVDSMTTYEPAGDASNITIGQPLEASGIMDGITLVASSIELKTVATDMQELEAIVEQVDTTDNSVTLLGQKVRISTSTIFEDDLYEDDLVDDKYFNLSSLTAGTDYISVDLYVALDGALEASKLERENLGTLPSNHAEIEGIVQAKDEILRIITVVNVKVDISALTGFDPGIGERVELEGSYHSDTETLTATFADVGDDH